MSRFCVATPNNCLMQVYYKRIEALKKNEKLDSRIRFMVQVSGSWPSALTRSYTCMPLRLGCFRAISATALLCLYIFCIFTRLLGLSGHL